MIRSFNKLPAQSISSRFYVNFRSVNTINSSFLSKRSLRTTTLNYFYRTSSLQQQEQPSRHSTLGPKDDNPFGIGSTKEKPHSEGHVVNKAKDATGNIKTDSSEGFVKKAKDFYNQIVSAVDVQAESAAQGLQSHNEAVKGRESRNGSDLQDKVKEGLGTAQTKAKEAASNAKETVKGTYDSAKGATKDILQDATKESQETAQNIKEKGQESKKSAQEKGQEISKSAQEKGQDVKEKSQKSVQSTKERGQETLKDVQEKSQGSLNEAQEKLKSSGEKVKQAAKEKIKDLKETGQDLLGSLKEQGQDVLKKTQDTLKKGGQEVIKNWQATEQDAEKDIGNKSEREHSK